MSAELKDIRWKITALAWCYIEAEHRITGRDHSEIGREILQEWAERKHRAHIETGKLLEGEGIVGKTGEPEGTAK